GAALAVAGATYQGLFRNPLADPYLRGIASGAGLGAVLAFGLPFPALLYGIGIPLLLAGIAIGASASALTAYLMYANGEKLFVIYSWMLGGFNGATWQRVAVITPYVLVGGTIIAL